MRVTPVVLNLLIINVLVYVVQLLLGSKFGQIADTGISTIDWEYFRLHKLNLIIQHPLIVDSESEFVYNCQAYFKPVQLVTHFFSHGGILHLLFNMFALYSIGQSVEHVMGGKRFLQFYLFAGLFGGILIALLDPNVLPVVGASGAISGVLVAFSALFPDNKMIIFPIPIPIKAKWLAIGVAVISLGFVIADYTGNSSGGRISHFGHLAGMLAAIVYFYGMRLLSANTKRK
jgi:membrane associated rhomboid family serine protease